MARILIPRVPDYGGGQAAQWLVKEADSRRAISCEIETDRPRGSGGRREGRTGLWFPRVRTAGGHTPRALLAGGERGDGPEEEDGPETGVTQITTVVVPHPQHLPHHRRRVSARREGTARPWRRIERTPAHGQGDAASCFRCAALGRGRARPGAVAGSGPHGSERKARRGDGAAEWVRAEAKAGTAVATQTAVALPPQRSGRQGWPFSSKVLRVVPHDNSAR